MPGGMSRSRQLLAIELRDLLKHAFVCAAGGFFHAFAQGASALQGYRSLEHPVECNSFIPKLERAELGVLAHAGLILRYHCFDQLLGGQPAQAHVARGDHEACGQSFQVPFPRAERDFIEIVEVEDELALRRREAAKVHQMRVAANGHGQARVRYLAKVMRLQNRAAPEERKWRQPSCVHI